jgi:predicted nucleic acid-binding protein
VLDLVLSRQVVVAFDERIFAEYADVLARPELELPPQRVETILDFLWRAGERIRVVPLPVRLPDPDDVMFPEAAVSALAGALVTGNVRHYPPDQRHGVRVLTPREYLVAWAEGRG